MVEDSDLSKSGSAGLLLLRRFVLYLFRRLWRAGRGSKEKLPCVVCYHLSRFSSAVQVACWVSVSSYIAVSDLVARDRLCGNCSSELCVVLVYQVSDLSAQDLVVVIVAHKVKLLHCIHELFMLSSDLVYPCLVVLICAYQVACFGGRAGYHGFSAGRRVDLAGNALGGG
ncbi:hypothetical protein F511_16918 [Dorcoceras hygrometricum]|uniref:Uncharacterized protein n=1 Tax=Dorcoceras hygrometricum TaxID=472368 RepID=A0A2Z7ASH8_9LAMI|nr:hypothetical protein F511_16918 [Dorcoceras hygrometricum]